jgi:hypothetical protein
MSRLCMDMSIRIPSGRKWYGDRSITLLVIKVIYLLIRLSPENFFLNPGNGYRDMTWQLTSAAIPGKVYTYTPPLPSPFPYALLSSSQ